MIHNQNFLSVYMAFFKSLGLGLMPPTPPVSFAPQDGSDSHKRPSDQHLRLQSSYGINDFLIVLFMLISCGNFFELHNFTAAIFL
jgi:hypothetical protein